MSAHRAFSRWAITIEAHDVQRRWVIPAQTIELVANDARTARVEAIRAAHQAAGVPSGTDYAEHRSLQHARAVQIKPAAAEARSDNVGRAA